MGALVLPCHAHGMQREPGIAARVHALVWGEGAWAGGGKSACDHPRASLFSPCRFTQLTAALPRPAPTLPARRFVNDGIYAGERRGVAGRGG